MLMVRYSETKLENASSTATTATPKTTESPACPNAVAKETPNNFLLANWWFFPSDKVYPSDQKQICEGCQRLLRQPKTEGEQSPIFTPLSGGTVMKGSRSHLGPSCSTVGIEIKICSLRSDIHYDLDSPPTSVDQRPLRNQERTQR